MVTLSVKFGNTSERSAGGEHHNTIMTKRPYLFKCRFVYREQFLQLIHRWWLIWLPDNLDPFYIIHRIFTNIMLPHGLMENYLESRHDMILCTIGAFQCHKK
ncbi:MAG: hypothetical protein B6241_12345 [Spirochaetaceae bacterium 4572_59]|nr:MAG: hypothetical protein B6241_12345 [Spirochaetaceae bacterium 4572_59]